MITVTQLYRYPVKGLTAEALQAVELVAGGTMPSDRKYAIENGPGRFDPDAPRHLPKISFLMLMRDERLATLRCHYEDATETLTVLRDGKQVARGALNTAIGRKMVEQFFAAYMKSELRGAPHIVSADNHSFSDVSAKCLHLVNLASVRDLERLTGKPVDPLRFRANVYIDGAEPWSEFKWLDRTLAIGDVKLQVFARTQRCDAVNVDPASGRRDLGLPAVLTRAFGHTDVGVYARISSGGRLAIRTAVDVV